MLSTAAFNALLKILEEPPEHLMFILATTELHKVPATIKSWCQQFAFKRILPGDIAGRLQYVPDREAWASPETARCSSPGWPTAVCGTPLSLLDQCANPSGVIGEEEALLRPGAGG